MAGSCCRSMNTRRCASAPTRSRPARAAPGRCHADARRLRPPHRERRGRRPRAARRSTCCATAGRACRFPAGLMVRDARLDGQPVSLVEGPPPHVLLSRAGRVVLTLDIALPLTASAGTRIDRAARVGRADLARHADAAAQRVSISRWPVASSPSAPSRQVRADGRSFGRPNQPLTLSWKRKVDDRRAEQPLRTRARDHVDHRARRGRVAGRRRGARRSAARARARSGARPSAGRSPSIR